MSNLANSSSIADAFDVMQLPFGVVLTDADGVMQACNPVASEMLHLDEDVALRERIDSETWARITAEAAEAGDAFYRTVIALEIGERTLYLDSSLRALTDEQASTCGYLCCLRDVTTEHESARQSQSLQNMVEELTVDIGRILHANTSTLLMVNQSLVATIETLDHERRYEMESADSSAPYEAEIIEQLERRAKVLATSLERLLASGDEERRAQALDATRWESLRRQHEFLLGHQDVVFVPELVSPALRKAAHEIAVVTRSIPQGLLAREAIRGVLQEAESLERVACLADVARTRVAVIQMDTALRALRDFITADIRPQDELEVHSLDELVREAVTQLAEFARASNVDVVWRDRDQEQRIYGNSRDLIRSFVNLLHNAIKYSWHRDQTKRPWVGIRTNRTDGRLSIEFESWGVPITQDEIEGGLIFKVGYRGKWSTDRGRLGTGIGLADAKHVAESHGGELQIDSRPARTVALPPEHREFYRQPFITTVRFLVPVGRTDRSRGATA